MGAASAPGASQPLGRLGWSGLLGGAGWAALAVAVSARFAGQATDDIYITYRYAANLAHGRGLVFNPGERVFGTSDPGVALLLAGLHRATGLAIPVLGTALTAAALLAIAALLLDAARSAGRAAEGWLGGTLLLASAYVWTGQGAGPLPALALLLLASRLAGGPRPWSAGAVAGLAFCCRPDAALGAGVLGCLLAAESWRRRPAAPPAGAEAGASRAAWGWAARPAAYAAGWAAVAAAAVAAAWWYYGTPLPGTLAAKRHFAALATSDFTGIAFWRPAWQLFCQMAGRSGPALLLLGIAGQLPLFRRGGRAGRLLVMQSLAMAVFYTAIQVPFFIWYTIPTAIAVLYGAAWTIGEAVRRAARAVGVSAIPRSASVAGGAEAGVAAGSPAAAPFPEVAAAPRRLQTAATAALATLVSVAAAAVVASALAAGCRWWAAGGAGDWRLFAYRRAGEWIRDHTPAGATVAFDEVGILGYYSDHPIDDLIGLVSPSARPYAAVGDPLGAFLVRPADLVVFHTYDPRGGTRPILIRPWFAAAYDRVATLADPARGAEARIYRRRPAARIPPPRPPWPRHRWTAADTQ
jgi:hypothetical protein